MKDLVTLMREKERGFRQGTWSPPIEEEEELDHLSVHQIPIVWCGAWERQTQFSEVRKCWISRRDPQTP